MDKNFVELNTTKKIDAAFKEIEDAFGERYANQIRKLYESTNRTFFKSNEDLGVTRLNNKSEPIIELNKNLGNAKIMANAILHEVRHLRQHLKVGDEKMHLNNIQLDEAERFATATNIWQGEKLGLTDEDLKIFQDYYDFYRRK